VNGTRIDLDRHVVWYPGHSVFPNDIVRAENCHLHDADGNRYVDLESGVWCTSVGHGNPRVLRALTDQLARIAHTGFSYTSAIVERAAGEILSLLGFDDGRCVFLCSGSEAVEYGVRMAQSVLERPLVLTMSDSYFGAYGAATRRQPDAWFDLDWSACAACPLADACDSGCATWAAIPRDRIGAFLFEPGSSSGMVRFPPGKLVRAIVQLVRANGGLVLVNEVTTGIGRTGTWFGYQHYGIEPDFVAIGKGIGNGYPVSVAAFTGRIFGRLGATPPRYSQSHQNDPLGASVALEVVRTIRDEGLIERGRDIAAAVDSGLAGIRDRTGRIREVRSRGLMIAVELEDDPATTQAIRAHEELLRRGFIVGRRIGAPVLRLDPALTVEREDIETFLEVFDRVLAEAPAIA
jgi:acetylornithine aminotransferase